MERKQFTFYESFAKSIKRIRKAADRCAAYDAIVNYALYEEIPDLDKMPDAAAIVFELIKPTLDVSRRKAENGRRGGMAEAGDKREDGESKPQANGEQTASEKEGEKEDEGEIEEENDSYIPPSPSPAPAAKKPPLTPGRRDAMICEALSGHGTELVRAVQEWVDYKIEKRQAYKETGFKSLLTQIVSGASTYGDWAMIEVIRESMSSNYQGIMFDRLKTKTRSRPRQQAQGVDLNASYDMMQGWAVERAGMEQANEYG